MPAAGPGADGPVRAQARPVRVAAREHVHPQRGHGLFAAAQGQHAPLLQRDRSRGHARLSLAPLPVPRARADHPVLDRHARVREVHGSDRRGALVSRLRALAVIDGEHYPPVVVDALAELPYEFVAVLLAGGTEKLRTDAEAYGLPEVGSIEEAVDAYGPELVVDLSDEPVLGPRARFLLASRALAVGLPYLGADFRLDPPAFEPFPLPSLAVIGTGKRVGKTAVTGHVSRLLSSDREVVVVAMGRGGPPEPEIVAAPPTVDALLALSRAGRHAASDHLEIAALAGVTTVGCRRCGGGLAGATFVANVREGAELAASLSPDLVVFDGSGAAIPPVAADVRI